MASGLNGRRALLRFLVRRGRLTPADSERLEKLTEEEGTPVPVLLSREGLLSDADLSAVLAEGLKLRCVDLGSLSIAPDVVRLLRDSLARQHEVLPVGVDGRVIELAMANPLDIDAIKAVEFATGKRVQPIVVGHRELREAVDSAYRIGDSLDQFLKERDEPHVEIQELQPDTIDLRRMARDADLPPVIKLADLVLGEGMKTGASDVHIEPTPDGCVVRYRIDGMLEEVFRFPKWVKNPIIVRFKVMAKLDIAERRVPQDGRLQARWQERTVDFRVSSLPTQHGEKITLRILDASRGVRALDQLDFTPGDLRFMRDAGNQPQGMVLVTGPTGSGKTTTLYALIREIFTPTRNIVTIENPIEYQLKGINQVEINEKQGLTFAGVLRSVLRQDPDVILIGEIRDAETARIAFQASQTGHLVLSTLHTNDAAATVTRLLDLGVEPHVVSSSVILLLAQRLVRRICRHCRVLTRPPDDQIAMLQLEHVADTLMAGQGCPDCRGTGYSGRSAIYEVIPVTPGIGRVIENGLGESELRRQARVEQRRTLREDAIARIVAGVTTAAEVLRVVQTSLDSGESQEPARAAATSPPQDPAPPSTGAPAAPSDAAVPTPRATAPASDVAAPPVATPPSVAPLPPVISADDDWLPDEVPGHAAPAKPPAEPAPTRSRQLRVLVVDDEPQVRHIVQLMLQTGHLGLEVLTAADGDEALAVAAAERPDMVILDRAMPGMDGFEVCRRLRADPATALTPIMMLTAHDGPELVEAGFLAGADDYVVKPVRREVLVARVRRMLERTYGRDVLPPPPPPRGTPVERI